MGINAASNTKPGTTQGWFDDLVSSIRYDQVCFENEIMDEEKQKVYQGLMNDDINPLLKELKSTANAHYVRQLLVEYFEQIKSFIGKADKLAVSLSQYRLYVWAQIEADDYDIEAKFILAEAKVNAKFFDDGFGISSTIVETSDNLEIPNHYHIIARG